MAKQTINLGTTPGDGAGDPLREAFDKVNDNFTELYSGLDGKAASSHTHTIANVTGLQTALDGKASTTHGHAIADVTGLQTALDGKAATSHGHAIGDVTGLQDELDGKAASSHTHTIANVTGLQTALDGKAASSHTHTIANVTGLQTALDGKAASSHTHTIANVTGLQTALDGKASTTHGHAIGDVTGLQTELDGKAATTHGHAIADVTGLQDELDGKAATTHGHAIADVTGLQDELDGKLAKTGGTLEAGAEIAFSNGSKIKVGTTDAGTGGAGGLAQVCSIQYEKKWEAGLTYILEQDGETIRTVRDALGAPGAGHDTTKGYAVGTRWTLDNGDVFVCRDATEAAAVWEVICDCEIGVALSDETTDLTTGTSVVRLSMPFAMYVRDLFLCCSTAPTGAAIAVEAKVGGSAFAGAEIPIDAFDSIGNSGVDTGLLARASVISFDVTAVGSTVAGKGLKVWLRGGRR